MSKASILVAGGFLLTLVGGLTRAESVPEYSAARVIELTKQDSNEKTPVISGVTIDPVGKILVVIGDDHLVRILDLQTGAVISRKRSHSDWCKAVAFRPDGKVLATSGDDRRIYLWDPLQSQAHAQELAKQPQAIYCLAYSPDGRTLATAGFDDKVRIYNAIKGELSCDQPVPGGDIRAICFSPDGSRLAAAGRAGIVRVWTIGDCEQVLNVQASARRISAIAYSPDGRLLAVAGQQRVVRLLDASSGKCMADLPERPGEVLALCFCGPDLLASAGSSNVIHLWDVVARQERGRLVGHTGSVTTLAFDRDTATLISGSYDTTVRLWDLRNQDQEKVTRHIGSPRAN